MIVFDYNVCPTLILAAILGEALQFAMGVHISVRNCHLLTSVMKSLLYFEAFKIRFVLANEYNRMTYFFNITFKQWFHKGFSARCLATSVYNEFATYKMYQP